MPPKRGHYWGHGVLSKTFMPPNMLTDLKVRTFKPDARAYKRADHGGLYIEVLTTGSKVWRIKYRHDGKEKRLTVGSYPAFSLNDARQALLDAKSKLSRGIDPGEVKQQEKAARLDAVSNSFGVVALEWYQKQMKAGAWVETTSVNIKRRIDFLVPWIGSKPVSELKAPDILKAVKKVEERGSLNEAGRTLQVAGRVMRYAIANGIAEFDPCPALRGALTPHKAKHFAAITDPKLVAEMLRAFDAFSGTYPVKVALNLAPMLFVRPGELRGMRWDELDLDDGTWNLPSTRMKMREPHCVPLPKQAVHMLEELHTLTGHLEYVFPNTRDPKRMLSEAAINAALRRLGFDTKVEHTGHGFRAMARTILHEVLNFPPEIIEQQLAHKPSGSLGRAYNRTAFLPQRREMMQSWADYLDGIKTSGKVIGIGTKRKGAA